jgi:TP901 family phage tail tape measure protein
VGLIGTLAAKLTANTTDFVAKMNDSSKKMEKFSADATAVGSALTMNVTAPLTAAAGAGIFFANKLNKGMANVATLLTGSDSPQARIAELRSEVQLASISVGKSTDEMTSGLFDVISAFGDSGDTVERFRTISEAAVAGQATLSESLALSSAVTKAYGDTSAGAVEKVLDLAFKANELGQTTFPEMANAIQNVTSFSKSLGVSQEELFGTMATLTGVTGNASAVSTQLRSALVSLQAPTDSLSALYTKMGVESGKAAIDAFGLQGTMKRITEEATRSGKPLQDFIGRVEGQQFATEVAGAQAEKYASSVTQMGHSAGSSAAALEAQTDGINSAGFALTQLTQRAVVLGENFGNALMPSFVALINVATPLVGFLSDAVNWFTTLDPTIQGVAIGIVALVAAAGPVLLALGSMAAILPIVTTGVGLLGTAFTFATGPIGLVAMAVLGLITVWQIFGNDIIRFAGAVIDGYLMPALNTVIDGINVWIRGFNSLSSIIGGPVIGELQKLDQVGRTTGTALIDMMGGVVDANDEYKKSMESVPAVVEEVAGSVENVTGKFAAANIELPKMIENLELAGHALELPGSTIEASLAPAMETASFGMHALDVSMKDNFATMDGFGIAADSMKGKFDKLTGSMKGFLKQLLKIAAKRAILAGLNMLTGGTAGTFSSLGGSLRGRISKGIGKVFGFADGGIATRPTLAAIAETPGSMEGVIPLGSNRARNILGGGGARVVNLVIELDGDVVASKTVDLMEQRGMAT